MQLTFFWPFFFFFGMTTLLSLTITYLFFPKKQWDFLFTLIISSCISSMHDNDKRDIHLNFLFWILTYMLWNIFLIYEVINRKWVYIWNQDLPSKTAPLAEWTRTRTRTTYNYWRNRGSHNEFLYVYIFFSLFLSFLSFFLFWYNILVPDLII